MVYKRVTTRTLLEMKSNNEKISMLTAYDYTFAKIIDQSNVDVILVGDSASNVIAGNETTVPITLDEMIYHAMSVVKAANCEIFVLFLYFVKLLGSVRCRSCKLWNICIFCIL